MTNKTDDFTGNPALPLFYKRPIVLRFDAHREHNVSPPNGFAFAAEANAIPLGLGEFVAAMRHYPIVFADTAVAAPIAVTGLSANHNLFVDEGGSWAENVYIPAYVRRYPFIIVEAEDQKLLAVDEASDRFVAGAVPDAATLFEHDGAPSRAGRSAMDFCNAFHQDHLRTVAFVEAITDAGILVPNRADIQFPDGTRLAMNGFRVIDEKAYRSLSSDVREEWHQKGWSDLITLHLASQQNWQVLMKLHPGAEVKDAA